MEEFAVDFAAVDADHDGYIDHNELFELMKKHDPEFYVGFATTVIQYIDPTGAQGEKINLDQAKEYFSAHTNKVDFLFELKYDLLKEIENLKNLPDYEEDGDEVGAPPAEPAASPEGKAHQSNIKFKIGNEAEMRNRFELRLKKSDTAFEESFVRLSIKVSSEEKADKLTESINTFYQSFKETFIAELPESKYVMDRLDFQATKEDSRVTVSLKSNCPEVNEIIELFVGFLDQISESLIQIDFDLKLLSGVSVKSYLDGADSLYNLLTKNMMIDLKVRSNRETSHALHKLGKLAGVKECRDYFKSGEFTRPEQLLLYLIHTEELDVDIEMENTSITPRNEQETADENEMKMALLGAPAEMLEMIKQQYAFASVFLEEIFSNAESSIELVANISKLSIYLKADVEELGVFYKKVGELNVQPFPEEDDD